MIRASYIAEVAVWFLLLTSGSWGLDVTPDPPEPSPVPVADIAVTDHAGRPVGEQVGYGKLIIVSSAKAVHAKQPGSLVWLIEPADLQQWQAPGSSDIAIVTGSEPATIRLFQIVALDSRIAWQRVTIRVGDGARPPPEPEPEPEPEPDYVPNLSRVFVLYTHTDTPAYEATILNNNKYWDRLPVEERLDWRFVDVAKNDTALAKRLSGEAAQRKLQPPCVLIEDIEKGIFVSGFPLPNTVKELDEKLALYMRGAND